MTDTLTLDVEGLTPDQVARLLAIARDMRGEGAPERDENDNELWRDAPDTGWTLESVEALRHALSERGKSTQLAALDAAIKNNGYLTRADLYDLGGYDQDRRLNNWDAPFRNIVADLIADKTLPDGAVFPIKFDFPIAPGYVAARGLIVAPEIVRLKRA